MKNRSRSEIIAAILRAANHGATQTRIMYGAYLSYAQTQEYLRFLQGKGLLLRGEDGYNLTEQGLRFLDVYDRMETMTGIQFPEKDRRKEALAKVE